MSPNRRVPIISYENLFLFNLCIFLINNNLYFSNLNNPFSPQPATPLQCSDQEPIFAQVYNNTNIINNQTYNQVYYGNKTLLIYPYDCGMIHFSLGPIMPQIKDYANHQLSQIKLFIYNIYLGCYFLVKKNYILVLEENEN